MAWTTTDWACGHSGSIQLFGPGAQRRSRVAWEAGRVCMACWLNKQWAEKNDPRKDNLQLAADIAEGKGIRIDIRATQSASTEVA